MLSARLPIGMTRGLDLTSLNEPTEIRLNSESDRRSIEAKPNEKIASVLSADGSLKLQWKPTTEKQAVDQSLTANSEAIFDVREDGLRLTWRVDLDFRGAERDLFTLNLPDEFLVEGVSGENVRAWDVKNKDGSNQLNVTTLSAAKDRETFTVDLSRRDFSVGQAASQFDAPYLTVDGAALHKGVYTIRRSPIIELKTTRQQAASRIDENQVECRIDVAGLDSKSSPLGIESFQVLQFVTTPFQIGLRANLVPRTIKAETQSILRIGQSEADLEMRIKVNVGQRPIYKLSFDLPDELEIRTLTAGLKETWTTETIGEIQRIEFFFPSGIADDFSILLDAGLTGYSGETEFAIPNIKLNDVAEQKGSIAIQVDPALGVTTSELKDCESVLLQQIEGWLNRDQRATTRLALRTKGAQYEGKLRFTKIQPRVTVETVTNVRTTFFAIEETMLLDFNIQQAGIRQIQFELPIEMRNARIVAKLVSETIIEDVAENANAVRVTLNLQDDVIDMYRVVVEHDRQLSEARQKVPIPRVLTGNVAERYATLQNAGRDEVDVLPLEDFQTLNRQLKQFTRLKQKLAGGEVTMAYIADSDSDWPVLQYETKRREVFDTVAASIEFSKTTMVVDSGGAYRALQKFQVNNRSEQYLEIELPDGAKLLTVLVEGQPVKPVAWPAAQNERRLRIPLVKTPLGDLDYPVQLKYAGRLGELSGFREVEFPVIETLNINVQLSQLHLRLPESHRWMNFGGTMTSVDDRGELEEGYLSYKSRQIQQLAEQIQSSSAEFGQFSRKRAYSNLKRLELDMENFALANSDLQNDSAPQLKDLIKGNNDAIQRAQERYSDDYVNSGEMQIDNRANFNELVEEQSARISRNSINKQPQNFRFSGEMREGELGAGQQLGQSAQQEKSKFDSNWLERNQLNIPQSQEPAQQTADPSQQSFGGQSIQLAIVDSGVNSSDDSISFANPIDNTRMGQQRGWEREKGDKEKEEDFEDEEEMEESEITLDDGQTGAGRSGGFGGGAFGGRYRERDEKQGELNAGRSGGARRAGPGESRKEELAFASSLASLDIEIPERGVDFYFKSPRGKATVIVRPLESRSFSRWISLLITLGFGAGVWVGCWFVLWICRNTTFRVIATLGLLVGGLASLVLGILPVYGLIAMAAATILFIDWVTRSTWPEEPTELVP